MCPQGVEGELSQHGEVLWPMILAISRGILVEYDIEHPMELVLDGPMLPDDVEQPGGAEHAREQEVAHDDVVGLALDATRAGDAGNRADGGEIVLFGEHGIVHDHSGALLGAAMGRLGLPLALVARCRRLDRGDGVGKERALVLFEREHVIGAAVEHGLGHLAMAMQRIGGDDAALEGQQLEHRQGARDLVAMGRGILRQSQPLAGAPDIDQMQRRRALAALVGAPYRLAVDRHDAAELLAPRERRDEASERRFELHRIEKAEHAAERIVARDPMLQRQDPRRSGSFAVPKSAMSLQFSAPHTVAASAMKMTSSKLCQAFSARGSSTTEKIAIKPSIGPSRRS